MTKEKPKKPNLAKKNSSELTGWVIGIIIGLLYLLIFTYYFILNLTGSISGWVTVLFFGIPGALLAWLSRSRWFGWRAHNYQYLLGEHKKHLPSEPPGNVSPIEEHTGPTRTTRKGHYAPLQDNERGGAVTENPRTHTDEVLVRALGALTVFVATMIVCFMLLTMVERTDVGLMTLASIFVALVAGILAFNSHKRPKVTRRLSRRRDISAPEFIQPDELTVRFFGDRDPGKFRETMYDSPRHWIVALMIIIKPTIMRELESKQGRKYGVWKWFFIELMIASILVAICLFGLDGNAQALTLLAAVLLYGAWVFYAVHLSHRARLFLTTTTLGRFTRQLPLNPEDEMLIPAAQFTQFTRKQTLLGWLLGYAHFDLETRANPDKFGGVSFARDESRLKYAFDYIVNQRSQNVQDIGVKPSPARFRAKPRLFRRSNEDR